MTYMWFLILFLLLPIAGLTPLLLRDRLRKQSRVQHARAWLPLTLLLALLVVAVVYTTPWDHHLIATGVWWYAPDRLLGATIGRIPLEEMLFFPLQTLLVGLWFLWLAPRVAPSLMRPPERDGEDRQHAQDIQHASNSQGMPLRMVAVAACGTLWFAALAGLLLGWRPGTYLCWELVWALPPLALQVGLGADILWRYRQVLAATLIPLILYLGVADGLAIAQGIWTINPRQTVGLRLSGVLPLEELVFFSLTTMIVTFGLVLGLAGETSVRLRAYAHSAGRVLAWKQTPPPAQGEESRDATRSPLVG